jgi:hypothetical protein
MKAQLTSRGFFMNEMDYYQKGCELFRQKDYAGAIEVFNAGPVEGVMDHRSGQDAPQDRARFWSFR